MEVSDCNCYCRCLDSPHQCYYIWLLFFFLYGNLGIPTLSISQSEVIWYLPVCVLSGMFTLWRCRVPWSKVHVKTMVGCCSCKLLKDSAHADFFFKSKDVVLVQSNYMDGNYGKWMSDQLSLLQHNLMASQLCSSCSYQMRQINVDAFCKLFVCVHVYVCLFFMGGSSLYVCNLFLCDWFCG